MTRRRPAGVPSRWPGGIALLLGAWFTYMHTTSARVAARGPVWSYDKSWLLWPAIAFVAAGTWLLVRALLAQRRVAAERRRTDGE